MKAPHSACYSKSFLAYLKSISIMFFSHDPSNTLIGFNIKRIKRSKNMAGFVPNGLINCLLTSRANQNGQPRPRHSVKFMIGGITSEFDI